jgi:hypothetical protein
VAGTQRQHAHPGGNERDERQGRKQYNSLPASEGALSHWGIPLGLALRLLDFDARVADVMQTTLRITLSLHSAFAAE